MGYGIIIVTQVFVEDDTLLQEEELLLVDCSSNEFSPQPPISTTIALILRLRVWSELWRICNEPCISDEENGFLGYAYRTTHLFNIPSNEITNLLLLPPLSSSQFQTQRYELIR
jgi:hypothetical protein